MSTNLPAVAKQQIQSVENRVSQLQQAGQLDLPSDYSASNALRSAFLVLQNTRDMQKRPALEVCTPASITNALLDMVVQGLTPARSQGYFIAYGQQLVFQRSYFGDMALAKRLDPRIADIVAEVVYQGDEFEFELIRGKKRVVRHKQSLDSLTGQIKGAYCTILDHQGNEINTVIMSWPEITQSWKKSPVKPVQDNGQLKAGSTHASHPEEMAKRTVVRKACKPIINSGADGHLRQSVTRSDQVQAEQEAVKEIQAQANGEYIDLETGEVFEAEAIPEPEPEAQQSEPQQAQPQEQAKPQPTPQQSGPQPEF
jgi:recombination protein RecT